LNIGWESVVCCLCSRRILVSTAGQLVSTFRAKAPAIAVGEFQGLTLRNAVTIIHTHSTNSNIIRTFKCVIYS